MPHSLSYSTVSVAHNGMTEEQISQNIIAAAKRLSETIPGGAVNIRNLHIKTALSPAILIYVSLGKCLPHDFYFLGTFIKSTRFCTSVQKFIFERNQSNCNSHSYIQCQVRFVCRIFEYN